MTDLVRTVLTGAIAGGIYSLIGVGLVVTYSVTGIFDLGYGGVAFASALLFYELNTGLGWNRFIAALAVLLVFCPALGVLLDVALYRPLAKANETVKLVTSVGVLVALPALVQLVIHQGIEWFDWSIPLADDVAATPGVVAQPAKNWSLPGRIVINSNQLTVLVVGALVCLALWLMFKSRLGLEMRAVRDRRDLALLRGVNERRTTLAAAVIGSMLAGLAGLAGAPILSALNVGVFTLALVVAAAAVVLGRFHSPPWTFAGGLLLGVLVNLVFRYVKIEEVPQLNQSAPFVVLLIGLVVLGRSNRRVAGSVSSERASTDWRADLSTWRRLRIPIIGSAGFVALAFFQFGDYWSTLTLRSLAVSMVLLSVTVVTGIGGMVSLAQSALAATAALTTAMLINDHGWPFLPAAVAGISASVLLGLIVALPSTRLGGVPFALSTLALALMANTLLLNSRKMTNGGFGWLVKRPGFLGLDTATDRTLIPFAAALLALVIWMTSNLRRSVTGRQLYAVRATQAAADSLGISAPATRLRLFAVSSALAGLGGVLLTVVDRGASSQSLPPLAGLMWLTVVVVLGVNRPAAAAVGGLALVLWPGLMGAGFTAPFGLFSWSGVDSTYLPAVLFGLAAVDLARNPDGMFDRISRAFYLRRNGREDQREEVAESGAPAPADDRRSDLARPDRAFGGVALDVTGLRVAYDLVEAVHDATFVAPRGKLTVLLGANGAGKSTICKAVAGELDPTSGTMSLDDASLGSGTLARWRSGLVLVPETRGVFPGLTVADNLRLSLPTAEARARALERFPALAARTHVAAGALSGGEQQMLSLAGSLADPPALLIVDEPTLGLAPLVAGAVLEELRQLADRGTTVLVAEEKQHATTAVADHVVLVALGRTIWQGPPSEVPADLLALAYGLHTETVSASEPVAQP